VDLTATLITTNTITVTWSPPTLQYSIHSAILEYYLECYPQEDNLPTDYISEKRFDGDMQPLECMFTNLLPDVVYIVRAKCYTLAGWSDFSKSIKPLTVSYVPDIPEPLQICKVTTNGILLQWHPPLRTNGRRVDHYQLEIIDARSASCMESLEELVVVTAPTMMKMETKLSIEDDDDDGDDGRKAVLAMLPQQSITIDSKDQSLSTIAKNRKLKRLKIQSLQGTYGNASVIILQYC